ncbi:hypothetical protein F7725_000130 [Dissostichus mawsoni]|uniref:Uncharacterized protein n=1 Tax=Dissostichus mawsoni TaxID=36200 RepID=A0A7J5ZDH5_DISMA|nr:hypothetical protein F7725_000130 [Dissostichus mawsoni]
MDLCSGGGLQYLSHCTFSVQHCRATVEQMPQVGGGVEQKPRVMSAPRWSSAQQQGGGGGGGGAEPQRSGCRHTQHDSLHSTVYTCQPARILDRAAEHGAIELSRDSVQDQLSAAWYSLPSSRSPPTRVQTFYELDRVIPVQIAPPCRKLTAGGPSLKPWTVIRTVSPTLALLGLMDSLGPLGVADRKVKQHCDLGLHGHGQSRVVHLTAEQSLIVQLGVEAPGQHGPHLHGAVPCRLLLLLEVVERWGNSRLTTVSGIASVVVSGSDSDSCSWPLSEPRGPSWPSRASFPSSSSRDRDFWTLVSSRSLPVRARELQLFSSLGPFLLSSTEEETWTVGTTSISSPSRLNTISTAIDDFLFSNKTSSTSHSLLWELLKAYLRGQIISYASHFNRTRKSIPSPFTSNPIVLSTLKIWYQFRKHFKFSSAPLQGPVDMNHLFTPSLMDCVFSLWKRKGIRSLQDLFVNNSFSSFQTLASRCSLPASHLFFNALRKLPSDEEL